MIDFLLHFDQVLPQMLATYGTWVYVIVWAIIFCETGLVVMPFLPGDSMLFALGALAGLQMLDITTLAISLTIAAILGDSVNYTIGARVGTALLKNPQQKLFKMEHYQKAHAFYERYGGKAIILARFVPIVRTFAPFVAGVAHMSYRKFLAYNIVGGVVWVCGFLGLGYLLGGLPWVQQHFKAITLSIIVLSILPIAWELVAARRRRR